MPARKILVVGPRFADSFADNVAVTLEGMGHHVSVSRIVTPNRYYGVASLVGRAVTTRLLGDRPAPHDRSLVADARAFEPDVVLSLTWEVHPRALEELGRVTRARRVLWWGDAPANAARWSLLSPQWDKVYAKDHDAVTKLRLVGIDAEQLHEAMNPKWHRRVATHSTDAVAIAGNYYAYRQAVAARLMANGVGVALYGPRPPGWSLPEILREWKGVYLSREAKSKAFGEALACLNTFSFAEGNSLNCRSFEIAGAGGLQLLEHRPIVEECFEPGRELLTFRTFDELMGHVDRARRHPQEAEAIREAGSRRALAHHTYRHRLEHILGAVS
jgi:spore maturation protein CgeB